MTGWRLPVSTQEPISVKQEIMTPQPIYPRILTITDATADHRITVPKNITWEILWVFIHLEQSGATYYSRCSIYDSATMANELFRNDTPSIPQAESHAWITYSPDIDHADTTGGSGAAAFIYIPLPTRYLRSNWTIRFIHLNAVHHRTDIVYYERQMES